MSTKAQPKARKVRPDPVILEVRLSGARNLISELSSVHSALGFTHTGWANCECSLAKILRQLSKAIHDHLKKKEEHEQHLEFIRSKVKGHYLDQWSVYWRAEKAEAERLLANARRKA